MDSPTASTPAGILAGVRVILVGRFSGLPKREIHRLVTSQGGSISSSVDPTANRETQWLVMGEEGSGASNPLENLDDPLRTAAEQGSVTFLSESELWQRLGLLDADSHISGLHTPRMLAELLGVSLTVIRRWQRRGLIRPVKLVRKLPYFDFREVATARRLAQMLAAGVKPNEMDKAIRSFRSWFPDHDRPLSQLTIILQGKEILLRKENGLVDPDGQLRFDFDGALRSAEQQPNTSHVAGTILPPAVDGDDLLPKYTAEEAIERAGELEDAGQLAEAADAYRVALAISGPSAELCFRLGEVLYQLGEFGAAKERYFTALEIDEEYVEARANLGCLLAETGQVDMAIATLSGVLLYHNDYPDVHWHLARLLDERGRGAEAEVHWRSFLDLAPYSPWADAARQRLGMLATPVEGPSPVS